MTDLDYMRRAILLAQKGAGRTSPNPMVGAVIVNNGHIIGEGWHERCGGLHAERSALAACTQPPAGGTLYVTLEPCCHYGRTPPCTEAILEAGLRRVVIGSRDPNPKVSGRGAAILRKAGVRVEENFLQEECDALNPVFFSFITTGVPYVAMKYAMTADGKIATHTGASQWITGETARAHVHTLRHRYSAIMVGIGTVLADDPMLNCRMEGGKNPTRIICDSSLRIPPDSQICCSAGELPTIVATGNPPPEKKAALEALGITVLALPDKQGKVDLTKLMARLGAMGIDGILLEGGGTLNESMLQAELVQKVYIYVAPKLFGGAGAKTPVSGAGVSLPEDCFRMSPPKITLFDSDLLLEYDLISPAKNCQGVFRKRL